MEQAISEGVQYRILVIDDEPDTARLAREWLDSGAFQILEASDGQRGIEIATQENPDIILLDLKMPGIDGIAVAKQLKEHARTRAIPIMVLSACRDLDAKVQAFRAGADDYLSKPFRSSSRKSTCGSRACSVPVSSWSASSRPSRTCRTRTSISKSD